MSRDIIADNQTAAAISKLRRGEADDALRDEVQAATLSTMQKMLEEISEIKSSMWSLDTLKSLIDERQTNHCLTCPTKQWVDGEIAKMKAANAVAAANPPKQHSIISRILDSESIRYFILVVILVWAVLYVKTGVDGVEAVKDGMTHTISGGMK